MYNIGDRVVVIDTFDNYEGPYGYSSDMERFCGKTVTIDHMRVSGGRPLYYIREDNHAWNWADEMFVGLAEKEERPMVEHKAIELIDREQLLKEMYDTLEICEIYHPTDEGMNAIIDEWMEQKGREDVWEGNSLIDILSKHPDYVPEKGYIVKKNEYDRGVDEKIIREVLCTLIYALESPASSNLIKAIEIKPWSYTEVRRIVDKYESIVNSLNYDESNLTWRGMSIDEVYSELCKWKDRKRILETTYYIEMNECYSPDEVEQIKKTRALIFNIRSWADTYFSNLDEDSELKPLEIDDTVVGYIENSGLTIRGIRSGQKLNKVINKILTETGIKDKWDGYNRFSARLGDAASPTRFTRFTIISANLVDYWRMSFGSSWKSCHTIDKNGNYSPSNGGEGYNGMHASGPESYMLDPSSLVMYTVDKEYDGDDYELEPKVNRCMFHLGEGKFVMGRVYPQGTDGAAEVYKQWRQIFQQIISECMGVPNYWKTSKANKSAQYISYGTHYRDYECCYCDIAGWSYLKPDADSTPSKRIIKIGADPICPCCGERHGVEDNLECENCNGDNCHECYECGYEGDDENMHFIEGEWYCEDCCFYCEYHEEWEIGDNVYVEDYGYVCEDAVDYSGDFSYCDNCGSWYYNYDRGVDTEDGRWFCSCECAEQCDYIEIDGYWYPSEDVRYCEECESWVLKDDWNDEFEMCEECARERQDDEVA